MIKKIVIIEKDCYNETKKKKNVIMKKNCDKKESLKKLLFIGRLRGVHISSIVDEGIRTNFKISLLFFFYKKISHTQKAQKAYK